METKICSKCNMERPIEEFRLKKTDGIYKRYPQCKQCEKQTRQIYEALESTKIKRHNYSQKRYIEKKEEIIKKQKEYYAKPEIKEKRKQYREKNKEHIAQKAKEYANKHREKINMLEREKRRNDNVYRLKNNVRKAIRKCIDYHCSSKCKKTEEITGLQIDKLKEYLEGTFYKNYGYEWDGNEKVEIDHIIPLASANTEEKVLELCHYTNLQLLKPMDNIKKYTNMYFSWRD